MTWLADANYAQTSGYDADGLMTLTDSNNWAAGLDVADALRLGYVDNNEPDHRCATKSFDRRSPLNRYRDQEEGCLTITPQKTAIG